MTKANSIIKIIKEGKAQLTVPKSVFYNPVQEFNRDLSVLVVKTYLKHNVWHHRSEEKHVTNRGGMKMLDALSATGLRSIRYAKELGADGAKIRNIVANDISEPAVRIIDENIKLNEVEDKVTSSLNDAITILNASSRSFDDRFHIIDLDPFGTGAQFFDSAVRSIGEAGLLMVTCTDTAVLCGNASESSFARYGSMSMRGEFCHDAALRIILKSLESHATVYGRYIKPLLSVSVDFYVRLFIQVFTQPAETKMSATKLGQVYICKDCETFEIQRLGNHKLKDCKKQAESKNLAVKYKFKPADVILSNVCSICGGSYSLGGPIWCEAIHDEDFLNLLKRELSLDETENNLATFKRIQGLIYVCSEELNNPLLYTFDKIASKLGIQVPQSKYIYSALLNAGYKVSDSHTNKRGFKTDAPSSVLWDIVCQYAANNPDYKPKTVLAERIMKRPREKTYDFTYNPNILPDSKKLSLLRFQLNPEPRWGPMSRPSKDGDDSFDESRESKKARLDDGAESK